MNAIADNFWKILFFVLAAVGGWFAYDKNMTAQDWTNIVEGYKSELQAIDKAPNATRDDSFGRYWKLLIHLQEFKANLLTGEIKPVAPKQTPRDATEPTYDNSIQWLYDALGGGDTANMLVVENLKTNLATCLQFKLFSEQNLTRMRRGEDPVIESGPYQDEHMVISQRVPIFAAREAFHHPANFVLMPESTSAINPSEIDDAIKKYAGKLKNASILSTRNMDLINKLNAEGRK
jgi:hypothetical protein